jgi:SAM-dependent methyltransferase
VLSSQEFIEQYDHRSNSARAMESLHKARMTMVREHLPAGGTVVDLGGSSTTNPEGALLEMGYPHAPKELIIIDLPPDQRFRKSGHDEPTLRTGRGTLIRYLHRPMTDLSGIADASVDLVFSGQSIERVTEEQANGVFQEALRVLRPGGHFCLDTPNARLTRIQSPSALIHPEHKKEYYVPELKAKLTQFGFSITAAKGICPMPVSLASRSFDVREMTRNCGLSDDPETCYVFFLHAMKAGTP